MNIYKFEEDRDRYKDRKWAKASISTVDSPCLELEIGGRILYWVSRSRNTLKWDALWSLFPNGVCLSRNTLVRDATLEESKAACIKHYRKIGHTALDDY
jgi:hypothetical protein